MRNHRRLFGDISPATDLPGVRGLLRVSLFGQAEETESAGRHVSVYVNDSNYAGMEDNDLRGFLDGRYCWAWNQVGQMHVRVGRVGSRGNVRPRYGEHELLRVIQRWDAIRLPPHTEVLAARLQLTVEEGPDRPVRVLLYEVLKDWDPGTGGVLGNNVSVPNPGEVWWNEVGCGEAEWGLPGAGFAARNHPEADTAVMPLAEAVYRPGDWQLVFASPQLARYATRRAAAGRPFLFLLKASDHHEDMPGQLLSLYSGNYGDSRSTSRRPQLVLEWTSRAERERLEEPVFLEHGRSCTLASLDADGADLVAATFFPEPGYESPTVQVREAGETPAEWVRVTRPFSAPDARGGALEMRVLAARDPVPLGATFQAELADTWVVTGAPADQTVVCAFVSPTGGEHQVRAEYRGGFRWAFRFQPDELGRWHYRWQHRFTPAGHVSDVGAFDVVMGDLDAVDRELDRLAARLRAGEAERRAGGRRAEMKRFLRLQRAVMQLSTPEDFRAGRAERSLRSIRAVRSLFWGQPVPEPIPRVSHPLVRTAADGRPLPDPIPRYSDPAENGRTSDDGWWPWSGKLRLRTVWRVAKGIARRVGR